MTALLKGIEKGFLGNRKAKYEETGYAIPNFSVEKNGYRISYQNFGSTETFIAGRKVTKNRVQQKPRWFRLGEPLTDVRTQIDLVNLLVGEDDRLSEDVQERRQTNYKKFLSGSCADGSFRKLDVPLIAFQYRDIWGENIRVNKRFVREGHVQRRAFKPGDLLYIEWCMKMMIVGCKRGGEIVFEQGQSLATQLEC